MNFSFKKSEINTSLKKIYIKLVSLPWFLFLSKRLKGEQGIMIMKFSSVRSFNFRMMTVSLYHTHPLYSHNSYTLDWECSKKKVLKMTYLNIIMLYLGWKSWNGNLNLRAFQFLSLRTVAFPKSSSYSFTIIRKVYEIIVFIEYYEWKKYFIRVLFSN